MNGLKAIGVGRTYKRTSQVAKLGSVSGTSGSLLYLCFRFFSPFEDFLSFLCIFPKCGYNLFMFDTQQRLTIVSLLIHNSHTQDSQHPPPPSHSSIWGKETSQLPSAVVWDPKLCDLLSFGGLWSHELSEGYMDGLGHGNQ